jgi:hypothetical protein
VPWLNRETSMFLRLFIAAIAFCVIPAEVSLAQQTNLSAIKCGDFLGMDPQTVARAVIWLQGFYTYEDDPAVIDVDKAKSKEAQIKQYCIDHKDTDLIAASGIFMDKKYDN